MKLDRLYQPFQLQPAMTYKTKCINAVLLITFLSLAECAKRLNNNNKPNVLRLATITTSMNAPNEPDL